LVVFGAGLTCGAQFSTANLSIGESTVGGRLYAFDLFGSFIGALISSLLVIPLFGLTSALLLVSVIKASSAIMILSLRPFHTN
jgi:predicted membrane-bound spermidine synthase